MKLRLQSNALRLRLKRGEIDRVLSQGHIAETVVFSASGAEVLRYTLALSASAAGVRASLRNNEILVEIPRDTALRWAGSDEVGIEATLPVGQGRQLHLLVEKDFACLTGTEEENRDTFPNPRAVSDGGNR